MATWLKVRRKKKIHIVFGGWHPTALPDEVIKKPCVDQVVVGEGEQAVLEILKGAREPIIGPSLGIVKNWAWPDRKFIRSELTIGKAQEMTGLRIASFQAHRGCPFRCPFCAEKRMTGKYHRLTNPIRTISPYDVLLEIEQTRKDFNINYFKFVDATFDASAEYVIDFCKNKIEVGNNIPWEALIHASLATEEMFYWLKKASCNQVNIGCESGSEKILKDIKKGLSLDILRKVFGWAKKHGVGRRAFFLLGMPNETFEDIKLTEKFIDEIEPDVVGFTILCPYPGTEFYDHEKMKDYNWSVTDEYDNDYWYTEHLTNQDLKNEQARLVAKYEHTLCDKLKGK
jgi:radical SAM superfamily enzyme YgiQ (UPF0313 family)